MPEDAHFLAQSHLMQADEIFSIAQTFVKLGVTKIRLTGGEPLVRKDAVAIIKSLSLLPVELTLTTNGTLLHTFLPTFIEAKIRSINISIDSLLPARFAQITRRNALATVWKNIELMLQNNIHVKLNCVLMKGVNDDEIINFIKLTQFLPLHVRFIEFMPFTGNKWQGDSVVTADDILEKANTEFSIVKLQDGIHDTTKKYAVAGYRGTFAIITTMSQPFCAGCNRLRLTADGKMKNCLFSDGETNLLQALRNGEDLEPFIRQNILSKKKELGGQFGGDFKTIAAEKIENRSMVKIGG